MVTGASSLLVFAVLYLADESGSVERKNITVQNGTRTLEQQPTIKGDNDTLTKGTILEASFNNDFYGIPYNGTLVTLTAGDRIKRSSEIDTRLQEAKRKREDEDFLDLMVRIAETPEEWDRIQHVLRQINADENKAKQHVTKPEDSEAVIEKQNSSYKQIPMSSKRKKAKTESGWPNFSDIIRSRKKWKHYLKTKTQHTKHNNIVGADPTEKYNKTNNFDDNGFLYFNKIRKSKENSVETSKNGVNATDVAYEATLERQKGRPNFQYHRVTSNPTDEHGSNAILAVSVVKKSALPSVAPATTSARTVDSKDTLMPWSHARHLHKLQEQLKSISVVKSKLRHHWQNKDHRHHSHSQKSDVTRLNH